MLAILIDPFKQTVIDAYHNGEDLVSKTISAEGPECGGIDSVMLSRDEVLFLDDEGLLKGLPLWQLAGYDQPLAGIGLILGVDGDGESRGTKLVADQIAPLIRWIPNIEYAGSDTSTTDTTIFGNPGIKITNTPKFKLKNYQFYNVETFTHFVESFLSRFGDVAGIQDPEEVIFSLRQVWKNASKKDLKIMQDHGIDFNEDQFNWTISELNDAGSKLSDVKSMLIPLILMLLSLRI